MGQPRFPSERETLVKGWGDFAASVANWLISEGKLTYEDCPTSFSKLYFINTSPYNSRSVRFKVQHDLIGGMFMNTDISENQMLILTMMLIDKFAEDASRFYVKLKE